jgi:hypothetical protein
MADAFLCRPLSFLINAVSNQTTQGPATNLINDRLGRVWQTTGSAYVIVDLGTARSVDTVSLLATNAAIGDTIRVRAHNTLENLTGVTPSGPFLSDSTVPANASAEAAKRIHRSSLARPLATTARYWRIDVTTSLSDFTAGRLVIGAGMTAADNVDLGWSFSVFDYGSTDYSRLGVDDTLIGAKVLSYKWKWSWFTEAEARGPLLDLMAYAGVTRPVLLCLDPSATDVHNVLAFGQMQQGIEAVNYVKDTYEAEFMLRSKLILNL